MEINKVYKENCLDTMRRMPDNFVDMVLTSPPYDNMRKYKGFTFPFEEIAKELYRITKEGGIVVWVVGDQTINGSETMTSFKQAIFFVEQCGFKLHDTMIYERQGSYPYDVAKRYFQDFEYMFVFSKKSVNTFNPIKIPSSSKKGIPIYRRKLTQDLTEAKVNRFTSGLKSLSNIWKYAAGGTTSSSDKIAFQHPAIFPEKLAADHIYTWTNEGDLIYDPFGGSGTTAKMAHLQKRNWILSEISAEYCDIIKKRIDPYLSQTTLF